MKALLSLNKYLIRYKWHLILGTLFVVISNIFAIYPAEIFRQGIDLVVGSIQEYFLLAPENKASFNKAPIYRSLLVFAGLIIASALLKGLFMFFMRQSIIVMSRWIEFDLKNDLYRHYQLLDLAFYKRNRTGDLMARISEDVSQVRMYIGPAIMYTISSVTLFVMVALQMFRINAELTLYVLTPLPLLALSIYWINSTILKLSDGVQKQLSVLSSAVQEFFAGIRVVKAYGQEARWNTAFGQTADAYKARNMDLIRFNALFMPAIVMLIGLSTVLAIYVGGHKVIEGKITPGVIAEFILYVNMLTWPIASVGWVTSLVQRAAASQARINEFLQTEPAIVSPAGGKEVALPTEIRFDRVHFIYPDSGIKALKDFSWQLQPGDSLGIMGRTGSGKTTLAQLMLRLYDVSEGSILVGGQDLRSLNLSHWRNQIAYVPQDVFLFSDTIRENILFGLQKEADPIHFEASMQDAAQKAAIHDFIVSLPDGYNTVIGERGVMLSGGQKQRLSIARALIRKPRLIILDDCLSALDTATEEQILQTFRQELRNLTSIVIGHRVSSMKLCSQILVLDQGIIAEFGTHDSLVKQNGIYAKAYFRQSQSESISL